MANQTQDIELRIRATNLSKQTTDKVVDSLERLTQAQNDQIESAKKGAASAADLEKGYREIEEAAKALLSQRALTKLFESQSATLTELGTKLETARKAQTDFVNSLTPGAARTKEQEKELARLVRTVTTAEKQFERVQARVDVTAQRLDAFGINAGNLAEKQQQITAAVTKANTALGLQEEAILGLDAAVSRRRAAEQVSAQQAAQTAAQAAATEAAAKAEREYAAAIERRTRENAEANEVAAMQNVEAQVRADRIFTQEINRQTAALQAQAVALRAAADAAERQARAAATSARGGPAPVTTPNLSQQLRDIQSPADAALRSLSGINTAVATLEQRVASITGPVRDYRQAVTEATQAQQALLSVAGQLDTYQRQIAALRAARAEYVASRTAVAALVAQMRAGTGGNDIVQRLAAAQANLRQSATALGQITTAARGTQQALRQAGVDTRDLAAAEATLVNQTTRATGAMDQLTAAYRRNGAAANEAGSGIFNWFGGGAGGRTTLSYMQRLRGEVLGLAAGFVGLQASIGLADKSLDAFRTNQQVMTRLLVAAGGNAKQAGDDFKYLQEQADRIGVVFSKTAPAFGRLAVAARTAGLTTDETRYVFENFAQASAKLGLSADDQAGVFRAIEQMFNKSKVSAEELSSQLGDRLPGAINIFAKAAGVSTEVLFKMMEQGQVSSDVVIKAATELGKAYNAIGEGASRLSTAEARFSNASQRFLTAVAEGGFVQAYQQLLERLTEFLNDGSADKLAQQLSAAFITVIDVIQLLVDNIELLKTAIMTLIGIGFVKWLLALPTMIAAVRTEMVLLNAAFAAGSFVNAASVVTGISAAMGTAGLTGVAARLAPAIGLVSNAFALLARWLPVIGAGVVAYQATTSVLESMDKKIADNVQKTINATNKAVSDAEKAQEAADKAKNDADRKRLQEHADRMKMLAVKSIKDQQTAIEAAKKKGVDLSAVRTGAGKTAGATAEPADRSAESQLKNLRKALEAEDKKSEAANRAARKKSAKEDLADRLKIIDEPFEQLRKQYKESIKDEAAYAKAIEEINASSLKAQAAERLKFQNEQTQAGESEAKKRMQLAQEIGLKIREIEDDLAKRAGEADPTKPYEERRKARVEAIGHAYDEVLKKIMKEKQFAPGQAAEDEKRVKALIAQRGALEAQNSDREEANRLTDVFNRKQGILKSQIETITTQASLGLKTYSEANTEINAAIAQLGPGVQNAGEAALKFAMSVQDMLDPTRYAEIVSTVTQGLGRMNVDAQTAANNVNNAQRELNELLATQAREQEAIRLQRQLGAIDAQAEVEALNAVTLKYAAGIQFASDQLLAFIETARKAGGLTAEQLNALQAAAEKVRATSQAGMVVAQEWQQTLVGSVAQGGVKLFEDMATAMGEVILGQKSISEGFKGMLKSAGQFFASVLRDIAQLILKQLILKAIGSFFGPTSGIGSAAMQLAGGHHTGGTVGNSTAFSRRVPASSFMGAPRFHNGGLPGFAPDEVPAILQKGEEVLTRGDPRNVLNGGAAPAGDASNRFVLVDDRKNVPQAMASSAGEKVTLVHLKNNIPTLRQWLK